MSIENSNIQAEESVSIKDLFFECLSKWYWFAATVFISLLVAFLHISSTLPVYTRTADVMIKEDSKSSSLSSTANAFDNLGIFKTQSNVYNEQIAIHSPAVMGEVIKRLGLNINYTAKNGLRSSVLYGTSLPFTVQLLDVNENQFAEMYLAVTKDGKITFTDFSIDGNKFDLKTEGKFNDTIISPIGQIIVAPTAFFVPNVDYQNIKVNKISNYYATMYYNNMFSVELADQYSSVLRLGINDYSIQRADNILNTLIAVYNENWIQDKNQIAISTSRFIDKRLTIISDELGLVDDDISSFKSKNLLPDVQAASSVYVTQSMRNNNELIALNTQLQIANYVRDYINDISTNKQLLPSGVIIDDASISSHINEFNSLLLQRNNLVANSSERNAMVINMDNSLNSLRRAIQESVANLVITLKTKINNIQQEDNKTNRRIADNPNQAKQLMSIERQQKVKEALYLYLLQKREENELSQAFSAYNTRIITPPYGSIMPTAPKKRIIWLTALIIGLLIPLALIYIKQILDITVRGRKDIENLTVPFLGEIPLAYHKRRKLIIKPKEADTAQLVVEENVRNSINEAFRVVRTNLEFMLHKGKDSKVIMVSSFNSGSGKTFISINLATSLAIKNKKVLLIDMDMRRATLSKYIDSPKTGISNYLVEYENNLDNIIIKSLVHKNLDVIPVGTIPPNPTELLNDEKIESLLSDLRKEYDYILIDCPPIEMVADAAIINAHVDSTLFVVRAGLLNRNMLPALQRLYDEQKYCNLNIILNGTEEVLNRYSYRRYGYRYGYNYGYVKYSTNE